MQPVCLCGQPITFPEGINKSHCKTDGCGVPWVREPSGCWAEGLTKWIFTPIFVVEITDVKKQKLNHYQKYMKWRDKACPSHARKS